MMAKPLIMAGLGGAAGSMLRLLVQRWLNGVTFPFGTLTANVAGCFLIGILAGFAFRNAISQPTQFLLITGFCGGFTTFSAFSLESINLLQQNRWTTFSLYIFFTGVLSLLGTFAGYKLIR